MIDFLSVTDDESGLYLGTAHRQRHFNKNSFLKEINHVSRTNSRN